MHSYDQQPFGLYDPAFEHDACGVGFICTLREGPSHDVVQNGLQILKNLDHRGGCGCDPHTGDGAGILMQLPDRFLRAKAEEEGFSLPEAGGYGAGVVFLPPDADQRRYCKQKVEEVIEAEGQQFLGWRAVPTDDSSVGTAAREREPAIEQLFVGRGPGVKDQDAFERKLYVIRKVAEHTLHNSDLPQAGMFYVCSLSTRTFIYKGMLTTEQLPEYFPDLSDPRMESRLAMVHSRFSTNTFPKWSLAHPFRFLCHNGEINTLRGNVNWMNTRERLFHSDRFGEDTKKLLPVLTKGASDSAILDNALELLYFTGRSLPHAVMMMLPEAWEHHEEMDEARRGFYEYHACAMEPWDGPATVPFTDGRFIGAVLDRNGLRPSRYTLTKGGTLVLASETGVLDIAPEDVELKGRLQPGRMLLADLEEGRLVSDEEIKERISTRKPYAAWVRNQLVTEEHLVEAEAPAPLEGDALRERQRLHGYTLESLRFMLGPMSQDGKDPIGSMGDDTPIAVLSDKPRLLYDYFKQLFAQVTNPPLDGIREKVITSLNTYLGSEKDLFQEGPWHVHRLRLDQPVLTDAKLASIRELEDPGLRTRTLPMTFDLNGGGEALAEALDELCEAAQQAVDDDCSIVILSDRDAGRDQAPIPALLATAAVHHHLIQTGRRTQCGLVVESAEPHEVHHLCLLCGYGAQAVNPYGALASVRGLVASGDVEGLTEEQAEKNYVKACGTGMLKVMNKMGISTLQSYTGAQIFEAIGLGRGLVDRYFPGTPSRLGGIELDVVAEEVRRRFAEAYPSVDVEEKLALPVGGRFHWRRGGERHLFNPVTLGRLQHAVDQKSIDSYTAYAQNINDQSRELGTLRGLLDFDVDEDRSIPLDEVEPWQDIVSRFKTGAMSYGSLSAEAHETLAVAMNQIGGKSNTGEGGEDPSRYDPESPRRSRIKQVASGRFGVTSAYLASADEIQIKMAQGAKPGEGGQLPGKKVYPWIAEVRHSTPYVGLISPPPHHDIYSIEDLAQLIHDLKNSNPGARISVKLVSEVGVGTVAAGVAKGKADVVLISGHDGGTGASPRTSIIHAGLPWELGLSETHQTLVDHGLRSRIKVETDGQLKTGRDVAVAALLGADEFGFATAPLVAMGCIMMRKCHLNTCPVGIATQDPELRAKFRGTPEHVVNFFYFVAQELRQIMASLGFRTLDEMVGRVDRLKARDLSFHWKARHLDLAPLLFKAETPDYLLPHLVDTQDHGLEAAIDNELIERAEPALERGETVELDLKIRNINRTFGTMLSHAITTRRGEQGLPDDTITLNCTGSGGNSFCAFGAPGLTVHVWGDANDYLGKGLSGAHLVVQPEPEATFEPGENTVVGNVALYGATSGEVYIAGHAGERFAVRNSGVKAVVEGVGDHGCEYMTGGRVVVLGETGRNFAAGMSGGVAYVLDGTHDFRQRRCNPGMVDLEPVESDEDIDELRSMIERHVAHTNSLTGRWVLEHWEEALQQFVKVMPREYRKALERLAAEAEAEAETEKRTNGRDRSAVEPEHDAGRGKEAVAA